MPSKTAQQLMPFLLSVVSITGFLFGIIPANCWNNRNNYVFRGKEEEAIVVWDRAKTLCQDFRIHNLVNKLVLPVTPICKNWEKPPYGFVKVNFDVIVSSNKICYGVVVWDSDGFVLGGGGGFKDEVMSAEWRELYAFEESLKIACSLNITKAIFETDCASLVNMVKKHGNDITIMGYHIDEAYKNMESFNSTTVN
ncbi:hypothetical protein Godav_006203 [Gossypium davidsonii]|uniref:RNase H type-1 domain-containing protein n=1 Tax=Gossypium davidsonii TaxID=34287 RepID=A0A7J8S4H6_GOSDV|nr:hypothetical protein [Gossypium davidsonii]